MEICKSGETAAHNTFVQGFISKNIFSFNLEDMTVRTYWILWNPDYE